MFALSSINYSTYIPNVIHAPVCQKIAARFIPYYSLSSRLESIKQKISVNSAYTLSEIERTQVKEALIKCNNLFAGGLLKKLTELSPEEVKKAIFSALESDNEAKVRSSLDCFLASLGKEDLIRFSGINAERLDDTLEKSSLLQHKAVNSVLYTKGKAIWKELYYETSYFCHHLIETFIAAAGFNEIGGGRRHRYEGPTMDRDGAKAKFQFYLTLIAYPSVLFIAFFSFLGSAPLAGIVTGIIVIASIFFIPFYVRYLRPCPNQCSGLNNMNKKILRSEDCPVYQRADILDRIQNAFCAGKGVILTGAAGTGKTSVADSLASLIVSKKAKKGAGFLNKAQMFSTNANQFKDIAGDTLSFQDLSERFGDHVKSFVLFIDEIASLYVKDSLTGDSVKPFLTFLDKFPNVICATTTKEYDEHIKKDAPANRRLVRIEVKPLDRKELESALYQYLHYKAPEVNLDENAISYIIDNALKLNSETSQIDGAMTLLRSAINRATHITFEGLEKKASDLKLEIEHLENYLLHSEQVDSTSVINEYQQKKTELKGVKEQLSKKMSAFDQIKKIESTSLKIKHQGYLLAAKSTTKSAINSKKWLVNHATHQIFTDFLMSKRNELGLPTGINKSLIDDIVTASVRGRNLSA